MPFRSAFASAAARDPGSSRAHLRAHAARLDPGKLALPLVVICTVAGLAAAATMLLGQAERERQAIEEHAFALARSTAHAAEREAAAAVARLEALSASPALRAGDLPAFRGQIAATPIPEGAWFVLLDQTGRHLAISLLPLEGPLPEPDTAVERLRRVREVVERGRPTVSSVVWMPVAGTYATGVTIPAALGPDRQRVLLGAILPTQHMLGLLHEQHVPPRWRAALLDKSSTVIARLEPTRWLRGSEPPETWRTPIPGGMDEGLFTATDPASEPVLVAFARSAFSEWTAVVEVPLALLQEPRRGAVRRILLSAAALLALGLAAAWWLRGRIDRSLGVLRLAANAADERQRAAEARFRHYWEHTPEGLFVVRVTPDGDFVVEGLNPAHERVTGLPNAAAAGKAPEQCMPAEVAAAVRRRYRRCVELGAPLRYTETLSLPDGRRDWETSLAPMRDPETGRVTALFGTCRDVTERRRAERAVQLNEERLRLAQHAAGAGTWDWDLATGMLHASTEMYSLLGLDPGAVGPAQLRAAWSGLIHPEDRGRVEAEFRNAILENTPVAVEYRFRLGGSGGELRWMASRGRVVRHSGVPDESGQGAKRRLVGVAVDVTERRRAELAAQDTLALLQSSLDALTAQVAILDGTGRIVAVNAAWRRTADDRGAGSATRPGDNYLATCDAALGTSPEAGRIGEGIRAVARGEVRDFRQEYGCSDPGVGEERWLQLRVTRFGEGAGLRLVAAYEDITEVRRATEALKAATGRLLTLQDEERRRIARELHDTTVQDLAMAIVGIDTAAAARGVEARAASLANARGLLKQAVHDTRTLSYLLHPPLLDECGLAVALATYANGLARRSDLECELDLDDTPPGAIPPGLDVALFRVAQEALANAHRHSGAQSTRLRLRVAAGEEVELRVEDDGRGFADPRAARGGSQVEDLRALGVGIPSMRARLRQLGGTLRIETDARGTRVVATVPLSPAGATGPAPVVDGKAPEDTAPEGAAAA